MKAKPAPIALLSRCVCHISSSVISTHSLTQQFYALNDTYQQTFRLSGLLVNIKQSVTQRLFGEMKIVIPLACEYYSGTQRVLTAQTYYGKNCIKCVTAN